MPTSLSTPASNAVAFFALVFSLLALSACPGSLGFVSDGGASNAGSGGSTGGLDSGAVATSCANATAVLMANCMDCHNGPTPIFANLDLFSPGVETRLVGKPASTGAPSSACAGMGNLLNKGTVPASGLLIDKINNKQTCGALMPFGAPTIMAAADIACLQAWANGLVTTVGP